jgi:hypothetical protein
MGSGAATLIKPPSRREGEGMKTGRSVLFLHSVKIPSVSGILAIRLSLVPYGLKPKKQ